MKLHYYRETDSLYVEFKTTPGAETREVTDGLNVDLDADGDVVGFDIDHASKRLGLLDTGDQDATPARHQGRMIGPLDYRPDEPRMS